MRTGIPIAIAALLALAAGVHAAPVPGTKLEPFTLTRQDGHTADWKPERVTVISFCAFWCDTWKEQSRRLARCRKMTNGLEVDYITISVDGRWSERSNGKVTGTLLLDLSSKLARKLGINRIPYTMVVDAGGVVRFASEGIAREASIVECARECAAGEHPSSAGTIYLTFDDFPSAPGQSTLPADGPDDRLLSALEASGVPATFFCICSRLGASKKLVERAVTDGHSLQVHSWDHDKTDARISDCVNVVSKLTGTAPTLCRLPGREHCLNIHPVAGFSEPEPAKPTVDPYDYTRPGRDELKRRILLAVKPGSVILLHAGVSETVEVLPGLISSLRMRGFCFSTLPELRHTQQGL